MSFRVLRLGKHGMECRYIVRDAHSMRCTLLNCASSLCRYARGTLYYEVKLRSDISSTRSILTLPDQWSPLSITRLS
jgi:hypothetical protein